MKKFYTIFTLLSLLTFGTILTSCDDDTLDAVCLEGDWTGNLGMYYSDGRYTYNADYSNIRFIPHYDFATYGTGEEIDFFSNVYCPIRYQSFYFTWEVRNSVLYLHFPYNEQLDVAISEYRLNSRYFAGIIGTTAFQLTKLTDYNEWGLYDRGTYYGYGYYNNYYDDYYDYPYYPYYSSKKRNGGNDGAEVADSALVSPDHFTFGRRFNEQ